jgi:hypothetical protein
MAPGKVTKATCGESILLNKRMLEERFQTPRGVAVLGGSSQMAAITSSAEAWAGK